MATSVRQTRPDDVKAIADLSKTAYPADPYTEDQVSEQLRRFPVGHFVAVDDDHCVVGMCGCLRIAESQFALTADWNSVTARGTIASHNPSGEILYGIDTIVAPWVRRLGVAEMLLVRRIEVGRRLGCARLRSGARLSQYSSVSLHMSANDYLRDVLAGTRSDAVVSLMLKCGFSSRALASHYLPSDPGSLGFAAIMDYLL